MNDFDTNSLIRRMLMSATLDAAVHLGQNYLENLFYQKSDTMNDKTIVRRVTEVDHRSNRDSRDIKDWLAHRPLTKDNFVEGHGSQLSTAKVCVFSDSVLCLSKMNPHPESIDAWKKKILLCTGILQYREMDRIDGRANRIRVDNFPRVALQILEIQKMMYGMQCELDQFTSRIIFMSMYKTLNGEIKKNVSRIP